MKERKVKTFIMMCTFFVLSLTSIIIGAFLKMQIEYFYVVGGIYLAFAFFCGLFVWGIVFADKIFQEGNLKKLISEGKEIIKNGV